MSSLAVFETSQEQKNSNFISFPISGYSLALDFPYNNKINLILNELDKIVYKFKGRVYLTKDSRLSSNFFKKFYLQFEEIIKSKKKIQNF